MNNSNIKTPQQIEKESEFKFNLHHFKEETLNPLKNDINSKIEELEELKTSLNTLDKKERTQVNLILETLKKEIQSLKIEEFFESLKFLFDNLLNVYILTSETNEVFLISNTITKNNIRCSKNALSIHIKQFVQTYFNISNDKFTPKNLIDFLVTNKFLVTIKDEGYYPDFNTEVFEYQNEKFLNIYKPGVFETKLSELKTLPNRFELSNWDIKRSFKFNLIEDLIRHLTGDKRVYYTYTLDFLTNDKYENVRNEKEIDIILNHLKLDKFELGNDYKEIINHIITHCNIKLEEITEKQIKEFDNYFMYFTKWISFILQNPLMKLPTGVGIKSSQGGGKDIFTTWILGNIFGSHNISSIGQMDISEKLNGWIMNKRFIIANELEYKREHAPMYENLKRLMTNQDITIRTHYKPQFNARNYAHFLFFGNHDNMLRIEKGDRRYTLFEQNLPIPSLIPYLLSPDIENDKKELLNQGVLENELNHFVAYLKNLKVTYTEMRTPLETEIKREIQDFHLTDIEVFIESFSNFGDITTMLNYYTKYLDIENKTYENSNVFSEYLDSKNWYNENLIPSSVLFSLFKAVCKENQFSSRRTPRSLFKQLQNIKGFEVVKNSMRYNNKVETGRNIFNLPFNKSLNPQPKEEDEGNKNYDINKIKEKVE